MEKDDTVKMADFDGEAFIERLDPDLDTLYYVLAHRWMQDRPRYFPHNGGYMFLQAYLNKAKRDCQSDFGVFIDGELISLVTVVKEDGDSYLIHVTSPRRAKARIITDAVYKIGWSIFDQLMASFVYTMVPMFNGHLHRGSRLLAESCGLTPAGIEEIEEDRTWTYKWQPYVLTRKDWLEKHHGQTENATATL